MSGNNINVRKLLDSRDVSAYQKFIVFISFLIVVMDGFDVVIMGFVGPALKEAWNWTNNDLAPVLSAALFGLTFGAFTAGPLGDKFGCRKVLTASVFIFGLFTLLVATASSKTEFIAYRFIAGFAMGGIMPMVATLVKEYSPVKRASLLVTIVFAGFTVGAAGGGFLAAWNGAPFGLGKRICIGWRIANYHRRCDVFYLARIAHFLGIKRRTTRRNPQNRRTLRTRRKHCRHHVHRTNAT